MKGSIYRNGAVIHAAESGDSSFLAEPPTVYVNPYNIANHYHETILASKHYYMGATRISSALTDLAWQPETQPEPGEPGEPGPPDPPGEGGGTEALQDPPESPVRGSSTASDPVPQDLLRTLECLLDEEDLALPWAEILTLPNIAPLAFTGCDGSEGTEGGGDIPPGEELALCQCAQSIYWAGLAPDIDCDAYNIRYWYHPDYLGSVEFITDMRGESYQFFVNTPFGENLENQFRSTVTAFSSRFRFNGKEWDGETGNYYYGARYYDPKVSVWLSVDAMATEPHNLPLTPYHFSANSPINIIDPDGLDWYTVAGAESGTDLKWFDTEEEAQAHYGDQAYQNLGGNVTSFDPETGNQIEYYDDGTRIEGGALLGEVTIDGGKMSDHARTMQNSVVQQMHKKSEKMMRVFSKTVLQDGGDAIALIGYGLTLTGVGAPLGVTLAGVGNGMALTGSAIEFTYQLEERDRSGAATNLGFMVGGAAAGAAAKRIPGSELAKQILKQNAELKVNGLQRLVDQKSE